MSLSPFELDRQKPCFPHCHAQSIWSAEMSAAADDEIVSLADFFVSRDYETVTVAFPGTSTTQNIDCLTAAATDFDLTGQILWLVSRALSHHLAATDGEDIRGRDVLELGAGAGLVGLTATQWARSVVLTDYEDEVMSLLARNAAAGHGAPGCNLAVAPLSWGEESSAAAALTLPRPGRAPGSRYEVLLGADVVYWSASVRPLVETVAAVLERPGGVWLLGYTARVAAMRPALLAAAEAAGLVWEVIPWKFTSGDAGRGSDAGRAALPVEVGAGEQPQPPYPAESLARMELFRFTWKTPEGLLA